MTWQTKTLGELLRYEQPSKYLVKNSEYVGSGIPVLTANKSFILGYTDSKEGIYPASKSSPVIIFDDFTTDKKIVDFHFKVKSSAIKILKAQNSVTTKFIFGAMSNLKFETSSHKRYYISEYQYSDISIPDLAEQERIVGVLEVWDDYLEKLERKIELKNKMLLGVSQSIFGNKKHWDDSRLGLVAECYQPKNAEANIIDENGAFWLYGANGRISRVSDFNHEMEQIIVSCRGTCGTVNITEPKSWINGNAMVINTDNKEVVDKKFLYYYLKNDNLRYLITGSGIPQITGNIKKHKINLPNLSEQKQITEILTTCDNEIATLKSKKHQIQQQKKFLLKNLVSGTIRTPEDILEKGPVCF